MKVYLVGGAVRDKLLNLDTQDKDWVVVGATSEEMLEKGYRQVGKDFPVFLHPENNEEYALARKERKSGKGYTGFEFSIEKTVTLEEDLARRDLTVNAMALDEDGNLIDPYSGQHDLEHRILRHVTEAFREDPLRVLRVARFKARYANLGFQVADKTLELMKHISKTDELPTLSSERVWQEFVKALSEPSPEEFINVLRECFALEKLFPEIDNLFGVPQRKDYHPEIDTGIHTIMVLQQAVLLTDDTEVRFAAVVHDLGKAETPQSVLPKHIGHEAKSVKLIKSFCKRLGVPNSYRDLALIVGEHHTKCHQVMSLKPGTLLNLLEKIDAFRKPDRFFKFLIACEADAKGRTGYEKSDYIQRGYLKNAYDICCKVIAKPFVEQGLTGVEIKNAIKVERLRLLTEMKSAYPAPKA